MQFLTNVTPDVLVTNYYYDLTIGIKYSADICDKPWICIKAKDKLAKILYEDAAENDIFSCIDVGLIFLLNDLEVGECIPKNIWEPVGAIVAKAYFDKEKRAESNNLEEVKEEDK